MQCLKQKMLYILVDNTDYYPQFLQTEWVNQNFILIIF